MSEDLYEKQWRVSIPRWKALLDEIGEGWGTAMPMSREGDVPFMTFCFPTLRKYQIVAVSDDGTYDIWRPSTNDENESSLSDVQPERFGMTKVEAARWIRDRMPETSVADEQLAAWVEETLQFYKIPKRSYQEITDGLHRGVVWLH